MIEKSDFLSRPRTRSRPETKRHGVTERNIRVAAQAAPAMDVLTGTAEWDPFLAVLKAWQEDAQQKLDALLEQLRSPALVDYQAMLKIKLQISEAETTVTVLSQVMEAPKDLKEQGMKALEALRALEA